MELNQKVEWRDGPFCSASEKGISLIPERNEKGCSSVPEEAGLISAEDFYDLLMEQQEQM